MSGSRTKSGTRQPLTVVLALLVTLFTTSVSAESIRLQRPNLLVGDLDNALSLYRDVLRFKLEAVRDLPEGGYAYELFEIPSTASLRFAVLSSGSQINVLALTEVTGPGSLMPLSGDARPGAGLVLEVSDFDLIFEKLEQMGLKVLAENAFQTSDGLSGRQRGFRDYDGNLIILYTLADGGEPE